MRAEIFAVVVLGAGIVGGAGGGADDASAETKAWLLDSCSLRIDITDASPLSVCILLRSFFFHPLLPLPHLESSLLRLPEDSFSFFF